LDSIITEWILNKFIERRLNADSCRPNITIILREPERTVLVCIVLSDEQLMWFIKTNASKSHKNDPKYNLLKVKQSRYSPVVAQRVPKFHENGTGWW